MPIMYRGGKTLEIEFGTIASAPSAGEVRLQYWDRSRYRDDHVVIPGKTIIQVGLYCGASHRSYRIFLAITLLTILILLIGCAHKQNCLRAVVSGGESLEFKRSFVKYVNIENDDRGYTRLAIIYLTDEGKEAFYQMVKGNVGKYVSTYFGDKPIIPDLYIAEPTTTERMGFILKNAKDEALATEIIKSYSGFKTPQ